MVKNPKLLRNFEDRFSKTEGPVPFSQALKIFESMWAQALKYGVISSDDPLEGIEIDIKIASVLNSCLKSSLPK